MKAIEAALQDAMNEDPNKRTVHIYTDSLASIQCLQTGRLKTNNKTTASVWQLLLNLQGQNRNTTIIWVPGHADLEGNEEADREANEGTRKPQDDIPLDLPTTNTAIKRAGKLKWKDRYFKTIPNDHHHMKATEGKSLKLKGQYGRRLTTSLHQLRTNHCPILNATLSRWGKPDCNNGMCETCDTPEDAAHFLTQCPVFTQPRLLEMGPAPDLRVLQEDPDAVVRFMKATGRF